ncbi:MAG: hypothetical protein H6670_13855 [Anaerolineaceae bacterium]|nr:hypothetical protein [Anaerolineae bacterium]MCB9460730.1 hypothetical protein [Anaerolineaceae bacterium]
MSGFIASERPDGIMYWRYEDLRRDTTDEWTRTLRETTREYDAQQKHFCCVVHFGKGAMPTPYLTTEAIKVMRDLPTTLAMSVAMVAENNMIFGIVRFAMNKVSSTDYIRFFDTDEEAITWLKKRQEEFVMIHP